jgi:hypothetical protein
MQLVTDTAGSIIFSPLLSSRTFSRRGLATELQVEILLILWTAFRSRAWSRGHNFSLLLVTVLFVILSVSLENVSVPIFRLLHHRPDTWVFEVI